MLPLNRSWSSPRRHLASNPKSSPQVFTPASSIPLHHGLIPQNLNGHWYEIAFARSFQVLTRAFLRLLNSTPTCTSSVILLREFNLLLLFTAYIAHKPWSLSSSSSTPYFLCFYAYDLGSGGILPAEHPHKDKLHHVAVEEEELRPAISLRAVDRLHAACWGRRGGVREEDIFEGTELV